MTSLVAAVGWALLHFVWQGAIVAAVFAVAVRWLRTPEARYALGVGAMLVMLALPVATAMRYATVSKHSSTESAIPIAAAGGIAVVPVAAPATPSPELQAVASPAAAAPAAVPGERFARLAPLNLASFARFLPILVACWLAGVFILSLRLFDAWLEAQRLARQGTRPAGSAHQAMLRGLVQRLGIRRPVTIVESTRLAVPGVVGWLRPVVLLPAVALTGLTAQQVEAIIAHELAHVVRHDFVANLVQSAIETLFFYHPAVWFVSRRVREAREQCCDDVAMRVCGNPEDYARALLRLAERRAGVPALVAAATGGPLLDRVRRLVAPGNGPADAFPRWIVGSSVLVAAALLASAGRDLEANEAAGMPAVQAADVGADTVLHAPPGPLASRWQWARDEARRRGDRAYWVGYLIEPLATAEHRSIYIGRLEREGMRGPGINLRGRIVSFGDFEGFNVPGVKLAPLVGGGMPDDVAVLFLYTVGQGGRPVLARVHASSLALPVDLEDRPVMWLGQGSDAESVPLVRRLYDEAPRAELREDVVAILGVHSTSALVVPHLVGWVDGREPDDIRVQAIEWLGRHPVPAALNTLARAARRDRSGDVRREAAESVGEMDLPAATDTLIALARSLQDADARREAVEGLGERGDDRSVNALADIVRADRDPDIQREGAESLGESGNPRSLPLLVEFARSHPSADVRREAVETIGESAAAADAIPVLAAIARSDRDTDIQLEAIETLGELHDPAALAVVEELAKSHPSVDARREAVETMGEASQGDATVAKLEALIVEERDADVVDEAIETIAETGHPRAWAVIARAARSHGNPDVRRRAIETLGEMGPADQFVTLARELLDSKPPEEVWREVIESLGEVEGEPAFTLLVTTARSHADPEIRRQAFEALAESDDPRARKLFEDALAR
jgi:beta-lactamase regulating signal transducer with metallopeptidase domain/HEAT repeat protein